LGNGRRGGRSLNQKIIPCLKKEKKNASLGKKTAKILKSMEKQSPKEEKKNSV